MNLARMRAKAIALANIYALVIVVCWATDGISQTVDLPRSVVERYCWLDAQGANFSASNLNAGAIYKLLIHADEAAYDASSIIRSYRVGMSKIHGKTAEVEVVYKDLGFISAGQLKEEKRSESVTFHLTKVSGIWKIDGLRILSHISKDWLLTDMRKGLSPAQIRTSSPIKELTGW